MRRERLWVLAFLGLFFLANLALLTRFPLVHSDESWLAGLTRNMMESGSPAVTEPFFDLKPRYPHAIKLLFHALQMPFFGVFGYGAFAARLLSLAAGTLALGLFYLCCREMAPFPLSLAATALASASAQFLFASHIARQEVLLLDSALLLALILLRSREITPRRAALLAVVAGLSVGLHPNSALPALGAGLALLFCRARIRPLLIYAALTAAIALVFVGLSFLFDPEFPLHYRMYAESEFDLMVSPLAKLREFPYYLEKLWHGVSGTYVLPDLKPQLLLTPALLIGSAARFVRRREPAFRVLFGMVLGAVLGTILIGRYNQLSAVLWMFPCLLLLPPLVRGLRLRSAAIALATAALALSAARSIAPSLRWRYGDYLGQIASYVDPGERALGNLNAGFYFENGALLDVRNLAHLKENGLSFAEYVSSRGIEVILWSDEMDFIYDRRPTWNIVYGNPRYVGEAEAFLRDRCQFVGEFENPGYAVRIASEIGKSYRVRVYRVKSS